MSEQLSRRTVLQGLGAAIALPWLEAMTPRSAFAAKGKPPVRIAFVYMPNGTWMKEWTPDEVGALPTELPSILRPMSALKSEFSVLTGLTADNSRGPSGGHARAMAGFLTSSRIRKTEGIDFRAGISVDQVAATSIGDRTRIPSLQVATGQAGTSGSCDIGYSCAYQRLSWRDAVTPLPSITNPRHMFDRLFTNDAGNNRSRREMERRSVLDYIREDASDLQRNLGTVDRSKLDEYFSAIRELEQRIERAARMPAPPAPNITVRDLQLEQEDRAGQALAQEDQWLEAVRLFGDLMVLAFQTDSTRVCTFALNNEQSSRSYPSLGFTDGHHVLSHHGKNPEKTDRYSRISAHHVTQFAYLVKKLKETKEGNGSLLDNCLIAYGSGIRDGDAHDNGDLPLLLAGGGGGAHSPGRHIRYANETPLANLWLRMLNSVGAPVDRFGDSTGRLNTL
ncbi:MAG: DUF1552 domain-containing protein [Verrucomicrobiota bacterium]|nr:DUF1552 domain-containing protein [Verrucomicrobiota bacterium]